MTSEDDDLARLARRGRSLRYLAWSLIGIAILLAAMAVAFYPGPFGAPDQFRTIQIHMDLWAYFDGLGVKTQVFENRMVGPVPLTRLKAAFGLLGFLMLLLAIGSFVRLEWRAGLALIGAVVLMAMVSFVLTTKDGYRTAEPREFGVHPPAAAAGSVGPITPLEPRAPSPPPEQEARWADARAWIEAERQATEARASQVRAALNSPDPSLSARELAALHYTSAQVAYLEHDPAETAGQLDAISPADFNATSDADWRIRHLQEYAEASGHPLAPGAYRPATGLPFPLLRGIAWFLGFLALAALVLALLVEELARLVRRRLKRLDQLVEALASGDPLGTCNPGL